MKEDKFIEGMYILIVGMGIMAILTIFVIVIGFYLANRQTKLKDEVTNIAPMVKKANADTAELLKLVKQLNNNSKK